MIRSAELIAIFDISIEQSSKISNQYMQYAKEHNLVETAGEEEVKSIVVTRDQIFYSPISSSTLKKRLYQII